jgi:hypothetical protein
MFAAPFDNSVAASDGPFGGWREVDLAPQPRAVEAIRHVQQPERPAIAKTPAMMPIDHVMFGASGTARASGSSRVTRFRGLIRRFNASLH